MDFLLTKFDESWDSLTNLVEKMNGLKIRLEGLNARKEDKESIIRTELHPRKKLKKEVELWLKNVERINHEIQDLQQKFEESNVITRGFLKGDVLKKIHEVEELFQQGTFHDSLVIDDSGWIGQALSTTALFGGAAEICMKEIWVYLMDDNITKIGVWGMGGVGKTTIMKLIHNQLLKETEKFNSVIWVTVSKEMSIMNLQNRIARAMHKTLVEDEDETIRAGMIYELLARKGKYVLILDDLWDKFSLEEVGIPEPSNGSKLLITTRLLDVCHYLGCREVRVPTLRKPDAWGLFLEKVGPDVLNHTDLLPIVESVAEECDGLPLAIVIIASSMKGVRSVHEWRHALNALKRHVQSVNKMEEKVFRQLKFSYDHLEDEKVKHCFLCCALYPEDFEINTDELIELWIEEGLVEEMDSMQMEIDEGHTVLSKLKNSCLIEGTSFRRVKLHDLVRDMAVRITSSRPRFLVRSGLHLKNIPNVQDWKEDLEKVSLMENRQLQILHQLPPPKCPNLTTLLLSRCSIKSIPEGFFEQMHGLKILDLSSNKIKNLPNSISNLETLTTLLVGRCKHLQKMPSFSKLEALKKLDLRGTKIKDIPHGMERLVNLKYLDLTDTRIKSKMGDGILARLTSLRHLKFDDILLRGEEIGGLSKLEFFKGRFADLKELNDYAQALHARKSAPHQYHIFVGSLGPSMFGRNKWIRLGGHGGGNICCTHATKIPSAVECLGIENIIVDLCEAEEAFFSKFIIPVPHNIFSSLSEISIWECKNIKKLFSSNWVLHHLQNLITLSVHSCLEMEEIIASESETEVEEVLTSTTASFQFTTLPNLRRLSLWNLSELKSICGANGVMACDSIQEIIIFNCPKVKRISLNLPLQDDGQPSPPPSLYKIYISPVEWSQLEWDHPKAKFVLEPYLNK
ncbi:hypothetical protein PTKIN_Ptkin14bG0098400 [Pterospermum kingtungense]